MDNGDDELFDILKVIKAPGLNSLGPQITTGGTNREKSRDTSIGVAVSGSEVL